MRPLQPSVEATYEPGAQGYTNYIGGGYHADLTPPEDPLVPLPPPKA